MPNSIQRLVTEYLANNRLAYLSYHDKNLWGHIISLHDHHSVECLDYLLITKHFSYNSNNIESIPYIPVSLFKHFELKSIPSSQVYRTLLSSGTSGQVPSRIFLDQTNSKHQQVSLSALFSSFTGLNRPNILVIDTPKTASRSSSFTARKAGILGFSSLCRRSFYALYDDYSINYKEVDEAFNSSQQLLVFGFTYIIYQYLIAKISSFPQIPPDLRVVLLHGGGWKKLESLRMTSLEFRDLIRKKTNITEVMNYYGMIEQTGSIFFECTSGLMHTNSLTTVIPRDIGTLQPDFSVGGHMRVLQVLSALPSSYPGHSLLTDDIASIPYRIDQCSCGNPGLAFKIHGRLPKAEARGCSDTHQTV